MMLRMQLPLPQVVVLDLGDYDAEPAALTVRSSRGHDDELGGLDAIQVRRSLNRSGAFGEVLALSTTVITLEVSAT